LLATQRKVVGNVVGRHGAAIGAEVAVCVKDHKREQRFDEALALLLVHGALGVVEIVIIGHWGNLKGRVEPKSTGVQSESVGPNNFAAPPLASVMARPPVIKCDFGDACTLPTTLVPARILMLPCAACSKRRFHQGCMEDAMRQQNTQMLTLQCSVCHAFTDFFEDDAGSLGQGSWCSPAGLMQRLVLGTPLNPLIYPALGVTGPLRWMVRLMLWLMFILVVAMPAGMLVNAMLESSRDTTMARHVVRQYELAVAANITEAIESLKETYAYATEMTSFVNNTWTVAVRDGSLCRAKFSANIAAFWAFCMIVRWMWWLAASTVGLVVWPMLSPRKRVALAWWFWRPQVGVVRERYTGSVSVYVKTE
jgi:hypothetical protein